MSTENSYFYREGYDDGKHWYATNGFFDRRNSDFDMLRHCNLAFDIHGELVPFCQREIGRKRDI